jgi:hypothetical protein
MDTVDLIASFAFILVATIPPIFCYLLESYVVVLVSRIKASGIS